MTFPKFVSASLVCLAALSSCSTPSGDHVTAKKYVLDHTKRIEAADPSIRFEQRHRLYGCITREDMEARDGTYYMARWSLVDAGQPATLRLDYRQAKTGSKVMSKEIEISSASGSHEFAVIGEEALKNPVSSWKISIVRDKAELATFKSYMWE